MTTTHFRWARATQEASRWLLSLCLAVLFGATLCGCSSTSKAPFTARVTVRDFTTGAPLDLTLISNSALAQKLPEQVVAEGELELPPSARLYSEARDDASTKVQEDAVMRDLVGHLEKLGFKKRAQVGSGPAQAEQGFRKSIEIEVDGATRFLAVRAGQDGDTWDAVLEMTRDFLVIYNNTFGLQTVNLNEGEEIFSQPELPGNRRR